MRIIPVTAGAVKRGHAVGVNASAMVGEGCGETGFSHTSACGRVYGRLAPASGMLQSAPGGNPVLRMFPGREDGMILEILRVERMRTRRDRWALVAAVEAAPGVRRVLINQADRTLRVEREDDSSLAAIIEAINAAGYDVAVLA